MKQKLKQFFTGRYGGDPLNTVICVTALAAFAAGSVIGAVRNLPCALIAALFYVISAAALGFSFFRMLSRNLEARKRENDWFAEKVVAPIKRWRGGLDTKRRQKSTHKFFKCPKCRQTVRVPRGKGKIKITCPKCGEVFIKET